MERVFGDFLADEGSLEIIEEIVVLAGDDLEVGFGDGGGKKVLSF